MEVRGILYVKELPELKAIDKLNLSNRILEKVQEENIAYIYVFGSYVDPKYKIIPASSCFFGLLKSPEEKIRLEPNDLDILILTREGYSFPIESRSNVKGKSLVHGAYESWWIDTDFPDYLHLLIANESEFKKAIDDSDEMALRIRNQKQLIWKNPHL